MVQFVLSFLTLLALWLSITCVEAWTQLTFTSRLFQQPSRLLLTKTKTTSTAGTDIAFSSNIPVQLSTGGVEEVKFYCIADVSGDIGKYRVKANLPAHSMNEFLQEYIKEMNQRGLILPEFRPGKLPPSAMVDVRKYIASYAVEVTIGALCNENKLEACDEQCNALILDDETFEQIVMPDALGRDFVAQRDNWKEGQGFSFMAEFLASKSTYEEDEEGEASSDDLQEGEKLAKTLEENGILKINDIVTSIEGQGEGDSKKKAKKSKK